MELKESMMSLDIIVWHLTIRFTNVNGDQGTILESTPKSQKFNDFHLFYP